MLSINKYTALKSKDKVSFRMTILLITNNFIFCLLSYYVIDRTKALIHSASYKGIDQTDKRYTHKSKRFVKLMTKMYSVNNNAI